MRRSRAGRRSSRAATAAVCLLALTACADAARPPHEWFPESAGESAAPADGRADGKPGARHAAGASGEDPARAAGPEAYLRWGLDRPLDPPPAPPASRPVRPADSGLPAVTGRVPTRDRVVFLTIDDGWEKDPALIRMAADLGLPFSMFLSHSAAGGDYGYFEELRRLGNSVHGHTVTHPDLTSLPYAAQRRQVCGQQRRVADRFGVRPALFRPPYGMYDAATLRAAASCGVRAMPTWRAEMKASGLEYRSGDRLRPGDIVLAHFRGPEQQGGRTMTDVLAELVREIQRQGFTVARLEDYM
ncbi:polysaccharide deacetylase family protein [Streptomyces sp. WMMC500]|uniref:polysaccharide deacetylase family protein n=1 Tax=Streptomyces sp. WMMC500 TaxID=3015154 RepID=UPI00248BACB7|nr:polysaccharide deacetylase family protein [Streptomyces sp. WMMC500]WBB63692.1 polysaccharide deacetylase family protein [Streptomyces sp. WMMC500]